MNNQLIHRKYNNRCKKKIKFKNNTIDCYELTVSIIRMIWKVAFVPLMAVFLDNRDAHHSVKVFSLVLTSLYALMESSIHIYLVITSCHKTKLSIIMMSIVTSFVKIVSSLILLLINKDKTMLFFAIFETVIMINAILQFFFTINLCKKKSNRIHPVLENIKNRLDEIDNMKLTRIQKQKLTLAQSLWRGYKERKL